jgi:hypothetical protein
MKTLCRLLFALTIVLGTLCIPHPALAFDASGYFSSSYSVNLSKTQVLASEVFQISVTAQINCLKDLPFSVSEAYMTDRLVAVDSQSGNRVVLVPSYTLSIKPFPTKKGESTQQTLSLNAAFPAAAQTGRYDLVAELIEARAKELLWFTVTSYLPQSTNVGSITVVTPFTVTTSGLTIQPSEANPGEKVNITVIITNSGDLGGTYQLVLSINGVIESTRQITLLGKTSIPVNFVVERQSAGVYQVRIDGLSSSFSIKAVASTAPATSSSPPAPTVSASPTSTTLPVQTNPTASTTPTISTSTSTPTVSASPTSTGLPVQTKPTASTATTGISSSVPPSQPPPSQKSGLKWLLIGIIGGAGAGALLLLWIGLRLHRRFHRS